MKVSNLKASISIIALSAMLAACGGGSSSDNTPSSNQNAVSPSATNTTTVANTISAPTVADTTPTPATTEETVTEQTPVVADEVVAQQEETVTEQTPVVEETPIEQVVDTTIDTGSYSAVLSWASPDARENGEILELSEISGFEIKYKNITDNSYSTVTVNEPFTTSFSIDGLAAGTYEFVIATIDADGIYSEFSDPLTYSLGS